MKSYRVYEIATTPEQGFAPLIVSDERFLAGDIATMIVRLNPGVSVQVTPVGETYNEAYKANAAARDLAEERSCQFTPYAVSPLFEAQYAYITEIDPSKSSDCLR